MIKGKIKGGGGSDLGKRGFGGQQGFIAIIALGIFLMLSIFGIIVQRVTMDTIYNIQTTNKYNEASDIANSVMEYLRYEMNMHEAGYNTTGECAYGGYYGGTPGLNDDRCEDIAVALGVTDKDVEITMEIKGRSEIGEGFVGTAWSCPGIPSTECYSIPLPGTGDAGDRCKIYEPTDDPTAKVDHNGQVQSPSYPEGIEQIDYSCNWNKLAFGSSSTDRAAIPFYFDDGVEIISPFHDDTLDQATAFSIRVRPPCKPCNDPTRVYQCDPGDDETICEDSDRYKLDDGTFGGNGENEIVVQWQLSGDCDGEECGLIQFVVYSNGIIDDLESSAITESEINNNYFKNYRVIDSFSSDEGVDTSDYINYVILPKLQSEMRKPILTLFLSEKLISNDGNNIPYLEYQILTDKPIGSSKIKASAIVNMDGYVFEKILYKEEQKSLIDFAVQN